MLPHPLTNFEIQKYYQNEPKFNGIYSSFIYINHNNGSTYYDATYFDSFIVALYLKRNQRIHRKQKYFNKC